MPDAAVRSRRADCIQFAPFAYLDVVSFQRDCEAPSFLGLIPMRRRRDCRQPYLERRCGDSFEKREGSSELALNADQAIYRNISI
jgi:hypothetical protein